MATQRQYRREDLKRSVKDAASIPLLIGAVLLIGLCLFKGPQLYRDIRLDLCIGGFIPEGKYTGVYNGREVVFDIDKDTMRKTDLGYQVDLMDAATGEKVTSCTFYFKNQQLYCAKEIRTKGDPVSITGDNTFSVIDNPWNYKTDEEATWLKFTKA